MTLTLQPYISLMRLNRPVGVLLLLWPTLIALCLASNGWPDPYAALIFISGVVVMRSAGCVINDFADRDIDQYVKRTKYRPLATKQLTAKNAMSLFLVLLSAAFILVLQLNLYTILLSIIAAMLACIYPFTKRFTNYPQFILGLAFAWSIPMAYAQVQGQLSMETWLLFASTLAWVIAYDTQYAMVDKEDDLKISVKSTAIAFGKYDKIIIFMLQCCALLGFICIGVQRNSNSLFYVCVCAAFGLSLYQQWLIKDRIPSKCFTAFLNNSYFGMFLLMAVIFGSHST